MHPAAACAIALALRFQTGDRIVEHSYYDDHIAWVLPPDRLAVFARSGVVIDEDSRIAIVSRADVSPAARGIDRLDGTVFKTTQDMPRHRTTHSLTGFQAQITPRNELLPARRLDLEEAGMAELPVGHLCVGQSWKTRLPVGTSLGSGVATVTHTITGIEGSLVQVSVTAAGVISGLEYNLPRLLPGSIEMHGTAWFDLSTHSLMHESYAVRNRLLRTVKGKTIGFDETESVDVTTHVYKPPTR